MKSIMKKIAAGFLSLILVAGLMPTAALAEISQDKAEDLIEKSVREERHFKENEDGTATAKTSVNIIRFEADFQIVGHSSPAYMEDIEKGESIYVLAEGGEAPYAIEWTRSLVTFDLDGNVLSVGAPTAIGIDISSDPKDFKQYESSVMEFSHLLARDTFNEDETYYYYATIRDKSGKIATMSESDPIKVFMTNGYWTGPVYDGVTNENSVWSVSGAKEADGAIGKAIRKEAVLTSVELDSNDASYLELEKVAIENELKVQKVWQLSLTNIDEGKDARKGDVSVTFDPSDIPDFDGSSLNLPSILMLSSDGEQKVIAPKNLVQNADGTFTFILEGTSAYLGTFALVSSPLPDEKPYCIEAIQSSHGRIEPYGKTSHYPSSTASPIYTFFPDPGYVLDEITVQAKDGTCDIDPSEGTYGGNFYEFPKSWAEDASITATFRSASVDKDATYKVSVSIPGGNGTVLLNGQNVVSVSNGTFEVKGTDLPILLEFRPDIGYEASRMSINKLDYVLSSSSFEIEELPAFENFIEVTFSESISRPALMHNVKLSVQGGHGMAAFDDSGAIETKIEHAGGVTILLKPDEGYRVKRADAVYIRDGNRIDGPNLVSRISSNTLQLRDVLCDTEVMISFCEDSADPDYPDVFIDSAIDIVEVKADSIQSITQGKLNDYIYITPNPHKVRCGNSATFYLTMKEHNGKRYTLYSIAAYDEDGELVEITDLMGVPPLTKVSPARSSELASLPGDAKSAAKTEGEKLFTSSSFTIPHVNSNLRVHLQIREVKDSETVVESAPLWEVTASSVGGGWIFPLYTSSTTNGVMAGPEGSILHVDLIPFDGYYLKSLSRIDTYPDGHIEEDDSIINDVTKDGVLDLKVVAAKTHINAVFGLVGDEDTVVVNLVSSKDENGNPVECDASPSMANVEYQKDTEQTFIFKPKGDASEKVLSYYVVNGNRKSVVGTTRSITLSLTEDMDVELVWRDKRPEEGNTEETLPIYIECGDGGQTVPSGSSFEAKVGKPSSISFIPDDPIDQVYTYVLDVVEVDGKQVFPFLEDDASFGKYDIATHTYSIDINGEPAVFNENTATLTFTNISSSHRVKVSFAKAVWLDIQFDTEHGLISPSGKFRWKIDQSRQMKLYVAALDGYEIGSFTVNGVDAKARLKGSAAASDILKRESNQVQGLRLIEDFSSIAKERGIELEPSVLSKVAGSSNASGYSDNARSIENDSDGLIARQSNSFSRAYEIVLDAQNLRDLPKAAADKTTYVKATYVSSDSSGSGVDSYRINARVVAGNGALGAIESQELSATVDSGATYSVQMKPSIGYEVTKIVDNGKQIEGAYRLKAYTLSNIKDNHDIEITFSVAAPPGKNTKVIRSVRTLQALAKTGDLALPTAIALVGVACVSLGVALLVQSRTKSINRRFMKRRH